MKIVNSNTNACWFQVEIRHVDKEMVEVDSHDKKLPKTEVEEKPSNQLQEDKKVIYILIMCSVTDEFLYYLNHFSFNNSNVKDKGKKSL